MLPNQFFSISLCVLCSNCCKKSHAAWCEDVLSNIKKRYKFSEQTTQVVEVASYDVISFFLCIFGLCILFLYSVYRFYLHHCYTTIISSGATQLLPAMGKFISFNLIMMLSVIPNYGEYVETSAIKANFVLSWWCASLLLGIIDRTCNTPTV